MGRERRQPWVPRVDHGKNKRCTSLALCLGRRRLLMPPEFALPSAHPWTVHVGLFFHGGVDCARSRLAGGVADLAIARNVSPPGWTTTSLHLSSIANSTHSFADGSSGRLIRLVETMPRAVLVGRVVRRSVDRRPTYGRVSPSIQSVYNARVREDPGYACRTCACIYHITERIRS